MERWHEVMDTLVRDKRASLVGYAYLLCGDMHEAEDVFQDAVVKTFVKGRGKTTVQRAAAYAKRVMANEVVTRARRRQVAHAKRVVVAEPEHAEGHADMVAKHASLHAALGDLSAQERACIVLRYFEDMNTAETADALGLAEGTVKRYVFDATAKLRARLGNDAVDAAERETATVAQAQGGAA